MARPLSLMELKEMAERLPGKPATSARRTARANKATAKPASARAPGVTGDAVRSVGSAMGSEADLVAWPV